VKSEKQRNNVVRDEEGERENGDVGRSGRGVCVGGPLC